jgi:pimeloyl-ACP methyl ester carboxylesterase
MPYVTCDGANIFVDTAGEGSPLLLLHGFGMNAAQWEPQWPAFATRCQVFRIDLRAHGRSETTRRGYTYPAMARDVQRVMVQVGMDRLNPGFLVAHSISADAALQAALAEPRALRGVVVTTPAVWGQVWSDDWLALWRQMCDAARSGHVAVAFERFRADRAFEGVRGRPELLERVQAMQAQCTGAHLIDDERSTGPTTLERLAGCKVPLLVLASGRDRGDFRATAQAIASVAPSAELHEFQDAAHFPNLEVPEAFNARVLEFVAAHS